MIDVSGVVFLVAFQKLPGYVLFTRKYPFAAPVPLLFVSLFQVTFVLIAFQEWDNDSPRLW